MSNYHKRVDSNQGDLVKVLRRVGASVQPLSAVGLGVPDLLIGWHGRNILAEVKDPSKPIGDQALTVAQEDWHARWKGQVVVVRTINEALELLGLGVAP